MSRRHKAPNVHPAHRWDHDPDHAARAWKRGTKRLSGPVKTFSPEEIAAMNAPKAHHVTANDEAVQLADQEAATFADQKEIIRRANSRQLAIITNPNVTPASLDLAERVLNALGKASNIAKQWTQEERQGGAPGPDPSTMTKEEIAAELERLKRGA